MLDTLVFILLIFGLLFFLIIGMPVAFSLLGISTLLLVSFYGANQIYIIIGSFTNQIMSDILLAIPMFIFMACLLQLSGVATSIYNTMHKLMGGVRGGLSMATIVATAIIAALSGIGATGTITMGIVALPEMLKRNYNKHLATGCIVAGGALGPIIPPSALLVIIGAYSQLSVGKLFLGGILPGLFLAFGYIIYIGIRCKINKEDGPALPIEERATLFEKIISLRSMIMPIALITIVLGAIYSGMCTPTEASGIGAFGALIITFLNKKLTFKGLWDTLQQSLKITSMVMWIVIGGSAYTSLVNISGLSTLVSEFLINIESGPFFVLMAILCVTTIMGMFIDPIAITMICLPIFLPAIKSVGLDPYIVVLLYLLACTLGYFTPPFGMNLFYLKSVAPDNITMSDLYKGVIPFIFVKCAIIFIFLLFPSLLLWLPSFF